MEITQTPEHLVRRVLLKPDGRFMAFYNAIGDEQQLNPDAEAPSSEPTAQVTSPTEGATPHV
jgi:hypothetical protein